MKSHKAKSIEALANKSKTRSGAKPSFISVRRSEPGKIDIVSVQKARRTQNTATGGMSLDGNPTRGDIITLYPSYEDAAKLASEITSQLADVLKNR
jgi:hypothetical protein